MTLIICINGVNMGKYKKDWWYKAQQFQVPLLGEEDLKQLLARCKDQEERIYLILLYYTGARPSELLALHIKDIWVEGKKIGISIPTLKKGIGRTIYIPLNDITQEVAGFVNSRPVDLRLVLKWHSIYSVRDWMYRISDNRYCLYFFRHNRLSKLANKGVDMMTLKRFKGARSISSVEPYIQLAGTETKRIVSKID